MAIQRFNAVGGYSTGITATAVIDSLGNITGVGATFTGLIRANAGISASNITTDYLVVAGGSTFGAAVDHVFGLYNRGLKINAGKGSSEIQSYGNETLSVSAMGGNGTLELFGSSVTLGDDGNNNSTNIITDDSTQTITYTAPSVGHIFYGPITSTNNITAPNIVNSVNGLTGGVTLAAGTNITLTPVGNTITIDSTGGGGGSSVTSFNGFTGGVTLAAGTGITFTASSGTITLSTTGSGGGISRSITSITGSTTAGSASSTDYVYIGGSTGSINLTMPTAVSNTNRYTVKQSNTGTLTILTTSSQTIDGVTAFNLNKQYQAVDLISDNTNWNII